MDDDPLVREPATGDAQGGGDRGVGDGGGALDVVVERADSFAVAVQDAAGVVGGEVFPVQHRVGEHGAAGVDERVEELVVAVVADACVPLAQVQGVVEQVQVVGADVQDDGQGAVGVDAAGGRVDGQFPDADLDAADALVADAQDAFAVGGDELVDVVGAQTGAVTPLGVWVSSYGAVVIGVLGCFDGWRLGAVRW